MNVRSDVQFCNMLPKEQALVRWWCKLGLPVQVHSVAGWISTKKEWDPDDRNPNWCYRLKNNGSS